MRLCERWASADAADARIGLCRTGNYAERMQIDLDIDARGLLCPLPVLRLRKRMGGIASGQIARLWATDPAAHVDVPHFCAEAGHELMGTEEDADATGFLVRKG